MHGNGAGVFGPFFQLAFLIGKYSSFFQAEVFVICVCVGECLRMVARAVIIYILCYLCLRMGHNLHSVLQVNDNEGIGRLRCDVGIS